MVSVVLDAQAGSCGKGKFIGYIAKHDEIDCAINNFMSNAGHTYVDENGKIMTQHLPTSMVNPMTMLFIGAGAAITPEILFSEIIKFKHIIGYRHITIHPRAAVILEQHRRHERECIRSGSTFKGCGAAQADKIMRLPSVTLFGDWFLSIDWSGIINPDTNKPFTTQDIEYLVNTIIIDDPTISINNMIDASCSVLVEGSQGCDLDINFGLDYPHTTSRQCHAGQLVADCGISPRMVRDIIMIMRPYPIRISNSTNIGMNISSGDYNGSEELTWDMIKERCGAPDDVQFGEITTVTKKPRRVFEMNWDRLLYTTKLNRPTYIAINFVQYIDWDAYECKKYSKLPKKVREFIDKVEDRTGTKVGLIGTGASNEDIIDIRK